MYGFVGEANVPTYPFYNIKKGWRCKKGVEVCFQQGAAVVAGRVLRSYITEGSSSLHVILLS